MPISFSRIEKILEHIIGYPVTIEQTNSRIEELLLELGEVIAHAGTTDYEELNNKPSINGVTLSGEKSLSDLGITNPMLLKGRVNSVLDLPSNAEVGWLYLVGQATDENLREYVYTDLGRWEFIGFTNIVIDSSLSDTSENPVQNKVITAALDGKVNTETGKGLSTNDYTTAEKTKLAALSQFDYDILTQTEYDNLQTKDKDVYFIYEN
jgi:hypothetical protein